MNRRRQRARPARNQASNSALQAILAEAVQYHQAGRLDDAESRYRQILAADPGHVDSLHLLGVAAFQAGRLDLAIDLIGKALTINPSFPEALNNLGNVLVRSDRLDDALASYRKALRIRPDYLDAHMNLGSTLMQQGKLDEAATSYRHALGLGATNVEALNCLGNILGDLGRRDEAIACYRKAIAAKPDHAEAYNNLGATLCDLGRLDEAIASYLSAIKIAPDFVMALNNLASALLSRGEPAAALDVARRSLEVAESDDTKGIFVSCLGRARDATGLQGVRALMVRALTEPWGWASALTRVCIDLVKLDGEIAACISRAVDAWPRSLSRQDLFGANGLSALAADSLLSTLLDAAPICDVEMERFLTMARRTMLDAASERIESQEGVAFYAALARQCFINEYVFTLGEDEAGKADELRNLLSAALQADAPVPALQLAAAGAYFPLHTVPFSSRLLERSWPEEIALLLTQQIREPMEEGKIRATIPRLTGIDDEVSLLVQRQYEENPYPRWVKVPPLRKADGVEAYLRQAFPLAAFDRLPSPDGMEVLVVGCGTGQQPIRLSQQFPKARILAIDLSRSSLAYAMRKTRELNVSSIEYAQADLLKLGSLGRQFDVIQASGVLHHLSDPWAGWHALLSLLRPGGFMLLGLYSDIARRDVTRLRHTIAEQGHGTTANEIRRYRRMLMSLDSCVGSADGLPSDLFTISGCRDLLFHVHEHCLTLLEIERFLRLNDLTFLGFDIAGDVLRSYRLRFPQDPSATDLTRWQAFESEHPCTFVGMYQFWIQSRSWRRRRG